MNIITDKCATCEYYRIDPDVVPFCALREECKDTENQAYDVNTSELPMFLKEQAE